MRIAIVGAGRIGGNIARRSVEAGHEVTLSFSRDADALRELAAGMGARAGSVPDAVDGAEVVVVSVPWTALEQVRAETGDLAGRNLVDTTNPYGRSGPVALPDTAAQVNRARFGGARYARTFNTITSAFQAGMAARPAGQRPAMFLVAVDEAREAAEALVTAVGFVPVYLGGPERSALLEAPRRDGAVYGEEYTPDDARRIAEAWQAGDDEGAARLAVDLKQPG